MLSLNKIHHIAVLCSRYEVSKKFYTEVLGLQIIRETYREDRDSYKLDLALHGDFVVELFSFPDPPARLSHPEAAGFRHLAFEVDDVDAAAKQLESGGIFVEPVRTDALTGKKFTFLYDPDQAPVELYSR